MICRSVAEALAAGQADADADPPLTQEEADLVAAILSARQPQGAAA